MTAVELLPVHQFAVDRHLVEQGLTNYWGYNTIGFLRPTCATLPVPAAGPWPSSSRW